MEAMTQDNAMKKGKLIKERMFASECANGYKWMYDISNGKASLDWLSLGDAVISPKPKGDLEIPSTLGGKPVTSIGTGVFDGCRGLTSVSIPDSVTDVSPLAFYGCNRLKLFKVGCHNSSYKAVSGLLLTRDGKTLVAVPPGLKGCVVIPDGVVTIGELAFCTCRGLADIIIPNGVKIVDEYAFAGCTRLTSMTIPNGVVRIGDRAFQHCTNLKSVVMPNSVKKIGEDVFHGCTSLSEAVVPKRYRIDRQSDGVKVKVCKTTRKSMDRKANARKKRMVAGSNGKQ